MPRLRALAVLLLCGAAAAAADWPQWLGLYRDGSTPEKVAPWKGDLKPAWRQPVGDGYSAPVVAGGHVFVHARVPDKDEEEVVAFDAVTGKRLWRDAYARAPFVSAAGVGPRATPAVVLGRLYTFGITGVLTCYQADTGKRLWRRDVYKDFAVERPRHGVCCSPLIEGNRVLVSIGGEGTGVVALDTDSGEVLWKNLNAPASTSSPIVFTYAPRPDELRRDVVFVTSQNVAAVRTLDGALAWDFPLADTPMGTTPTPVAAGDLLLTTSMKHGTLGLRVKLQNGKLTASAAWRNPKLTAYFATPVLAGKDHLYLVSTALTAQGPESALRCVEVKTGKELWVRDGIAGYHAGLLSTGDGKLLLLDDGGTLRLLEHNPKEYRELAVAKVCGPTFVNPALTNGRLYVRDDKAVTCLPLK
jgi:outer membrane protein assembly factor BamB